jgi:polygalacturonase
MNQKRIDTMHDQELVSRRGAMGRLGGLLAAGMAAGVAATSHAADGSPKPAPSNLNAYDIRDFGAVGDGQANCTLAFRKAIDAATAAGGGTVLVPNGIFLTGTVVLKDNVTLHLAEGAKILGSPSGADYLNYPGRGTSKDGLALILAQKARNIAITGRGTINGQGGKFTVKDGAPGRPWGIKLIECRDAQLSDFRMEDSAGWVIHLKLCERVVVHGVTVWSHANYNNDGIDIDSCKDVSVAQCNFDCQDDAICLKSHTPFPSENIMVSDCVASSHCNLIKFGTGSEGGFKNITITNCTLIAPRYSKMLNGRQRGIGGINLELVDGGVMDRVTISNITMDGIELPLFIRLGDRHRGPSKAAGVLRNVVISNIVATNMGPTGASITGIPGHCVENVTLSNLNFTYEGGGTAKDATRQVPEKEKAYPEGFMFGTLPAWGLYCRHVRGLKLHNVKLQLAAPDARHAVIFEDVQDLDIDALDAQYAQGAAPLVKMTEVKGVMLRGCRPVVKGGTFLKLEGKSTGGIALLANDLRQAGKVLDASAEVAKDAVAQTGNLGQE